MKPPFKEFAEPGDVFNSDLCRKLRTLEKLVRGGDDDAIATYLSEEGESVLYLLLKATGYIPGSHTSADIEALPEPVRERLAKIDVTQFDQSATQFDCYMDAPPFWEDGTPNLSGARIFREPTPEIIAVKRESFPTVRVIFTDDAQNHKPSMAAFFRSIAEGFEEEGDSQ